MAEEYSGLTYKSWTRPQILFLNSESVDVLYTTLNLIEHICEEKIISIIKKLVIFW